MRKLLLTFLPPLVLGILVGYLIGQWTKEREWRDPLGIVTPSQEKARAVQEADPTPAAGTPVLRPLPLRRARMFLEQYTINDPVVLKVGSVGHSADGMELHIVFENRGACTVTGYSGVVYGYDAYGAPAKMNKTGETFLAINAEKVSIDPKATDMFSAVVKHPDVASLAIAHLDKVTCANGTTWTRN